MYSENNPTESSACHRAGDTPPQYARVVELAYTSPSKGDAVVLEGSTPSSGTNCRR